MDSIRATIDAAYIQGFLGFFGALLGALAIIISIRITAKNTAKEIKLDKLADSKRGIYENLVDKYTIFLISAIRLRRKNPSLNYWDIDEYWNIYQDTYFGLFGCLNKCHLVSESEIRVELFKIEQELSEFQNDMSLFYEQKNYRKPDINDLQNKAFIFLKHLRKDLGIQENEEFESELSKLRDRESCDKP